MKLAVRTDKEHQHRPSEESQENGVDADPGTRVVVTEVGETPQLAIPDLILVGVLASLIVKPTISGNVNNEHL